MKTIEKLEQEILKHKNKYYQGNPEISDSEYDKLEDELRKFDPENYVLKLVGALTSTNAKVKHEKKMLSLEKTYDVNDLYKFTAEEDAISMFKLDGVSCSLLYSSGKLLMAKTRGDGEWGENILEKILWIEKIPKKISCKSQVEIRGELYITSQDFFHLSEEMLNKKLERPTSQRNIVAGLMSRKDNLEICKYISFMAFDVLESSDMNLKFEFQFRLEVEKFKFLKEEKFNCPEIQLHKSGSKKSIDEVIDIAKDFMEEGDFQIDGLVFSFNRLELHRQLGETNHHPRYKLAYKFVGESKPTKILEIEWGVSRLGILTPVAIVEPVELSGASISRVTLHNYGQVFEYQLKKGDEIEIIRSGEVIPKFLRVIKSSEKENYLIPKKCPACHSKINLIDIRAYCSNESCPGKNRENILNFISSVGIEDLSAKRLDELISINLVNDIPDLFRLSVDDFLKMQKVKEKLAQKLFDTIQKSKKIDLLKFCIALGVLRGAKGKWEKIIQAGFNNLDKIQNITYEQLITVDSFAEKSSKDFIESLHSKKKLIEDLLNVGVNIEVNHSENKYNEKISGFKFCITGALSQPRAEIEKQIKSQGGVIVSSVTKNTNFLITNEVDGQSSKYLAAMKLKIKIINEADLNEILV